MTLEVSRVARAETAPEKAPETAPDREHAPAYVAEAAVAPSVADSCKLALCAATLAPLEAPTTAEPLVLGRALVGFEGGASTPAIA